MNLNNAHLQHKKELDSLLTLRFQHFDKAQIMTVQSIVEGEKERTV